jgi:hypothetical protein
MKLDAIFLKKKSQGYGGPGGGFYSNSPIQHGKPSEQDNASVDKRLKELQATGETAGVTTSPVGEQGTQGHQAPWQVYHDYPLSQRPWKVYDPAKDPGIMNNPKRRHYGLPRPSEKTRMVGSGPNINKEIEDWIKRLMKNKNMTRDQAEQEVGQVLLEEHGYGKKKKATVDPEIMARQPKSPDDMPERPFLCTRCGQPFREDAVGFIDRNGLPVHVECGQPGELEEYQTANSGNGYKLNPKYFPAWHKMGKSGSTKTSSYILKIRASVPEITGVKKSGNQILVLFGPDGIDGHCSLSPKDVEHIKELEAESGSYQFRDEQNIRWRVTLSDSNDLQFTSLGMEGLHGSIPATAFDSEKKSAAVKSEDVPSLWDKLSPQDRQRQFRMGNTPFTYSSWAELNERERALVLNAARIVNKYGVAHQYVLRWQESDVPPNRGGVQTITKEKWFPSKELRDGFAHKLQTKDTFKRFLDDFKPSEKNASLHLTAGFLKIATCQMKCPECGGTATKQNPQDPIYYCSCGWNSAKNRKVAVDKTIKIEDPVEREIALKEWRKNKQDRGTAQSRNRTNRMKGLPLVPIPEELPEPLIPVAYAKDGAYEGVLQHPGDLPAGMILKWQRTGKFASSSTDSDSRFKLEAAFLQKKAVNLIIAPPENAYYTVVKPFQVILLGEAVPTNEWYGPVPLLRAKRIPVQTKVGDQIHLLVGGGFLVRKGKVIGEIGPTDKPKPAFEKSYGDVRPRFEVPDDAIMNIPPGSVTKPIGGYRPQESKKKSSTLQGDYSKTNLTAKLLQHEAAGAFDTVEQHMKEKIPDTPSLKSMFRKTFLGE